MKPCHKRNECNLCRGTALEQRGRLVGYFWYKIGTRLRKVRHPWSRKWLYFRFMQLHGDWFSAKNCGA